MTVRRWIGWGAVLVFAVGCSNSRPSGRQMTGANPPPPPSPPVRAIDVGPTRGIYHLKSGVSPEEAAELGITLPEEQPADEREAAEESEGEGGR